MGKLKSFGAVILVGVVVVLIYTTRLFSTSPAVVLDKESSKTVANIQPPNIITESRTIQKSPRKPSKRTTNTFIGVTNLKPFSSNELHYEYKGRVLHVNNQLKPELVSAYFDFRQGRKMIAVLGCHNHLHAKGVKYFCLTKFFDGREKCLSQEASQELLSAGDENGSKNCKSYRYACTLDSSSDKDLPVFIALSTSPRCDLPRSDWIKIFDSRFESYETGSTPVQERELGVCYQTPLYRAENLKKEVIIESIERNRAMGAEWFSFYFRENPSIEVMQVLKQYEREGLLEVINMTIIDNYYDVRYYGELLSIRDCVYRNMHRAKYLSMIDFDEVIVPKARKNLNEMLKAIDSSNIGSFQFKHVALSVPPGGSKSVDHNCPNSGRKVASPMFITHTYSTGPFPFKQYRVGRWKVIVKPQNVDKIGIHSVYGMMSGYSQYSVPFETGTLFHYREDSFIDVDHCGECYVNNRFNDLTPGLVDTFFSRACNEVAS